MRHPLTSKERRGLVAVAAAALLCISSGFLVRNCLGASRKTSPSASSAQIQLTDSSSSADSHDEGREELHSKKSKSAKREKSAKKGKSAQKKKAKPEKSYPVRDPLSQPCD